jgi:hypothetical protein
MGPVTYLPVACGSRGSLGVTGILGCPTPTVRGLRDKLETISSAAAATCRTTQTLVPLHSQQTSFVARNLHAVGSSGGNVVGPNDSEVLGAAVL